MPYTPRSETSYFTNKTILEKKGAKDDKILHPKIQNTEVRWITYSTNESESMKYSKS